MDWQHFTPFSALLGGALIGLSAVLLMLFIGRIAGVSGILGLIVKRALGFTRETIAWRLAFIGGLIASGALAFIVSPTLAINATSNPIRLILAGLLVGLGTRLARGCTSGHGVCGLSRFSLRSLCATLTFIGWGFLTVFLTQ